MPDPIKVLIVDDSALTREILRQGLNQDPNIEVIGTAAGADEAHAFLKRQRPDVLTLDVEMPGTSGVEFLKQLMPRSPIPVVMVSAFTERGKQITLDALEAGAVDFVAKPKASNPQRLTAMLLELRTKIKIACIANVSIWKHRPPARPGNLQGGHALKPHDETVIAIGASTGGTEAIREIITRLPAETPAVVIVQHMPAGFTRMYAERMNELCAMEVKEAADRDEICQGRILIAPGGKHLRVANGPDGLFAHVAEERPVSGHCPSVDVLLQSVASQVGKSAIGVILTGMGRDGADGMSALRKAGALCLGQDEETCIIFGMPRAAHERGGVDRLLPLNEISPAILKGICERDKGSTRNSENPQTGGAKPKEPC